MERTRTPEIKLAFAAVALLVAALLNTRPFDAAPKPAPHEAPEVSAREVATPPDPQQIEQLLRLEYHTVSDG